MAAMVSGWWERAANMPGAGKMAASVASTRRRGRAGSASSSSSRSQGSRIGKGCCERLGERVSAAQEQQGCQAQLTQPG
jgi:hypothetical protein